MTKTKTSEEIEVEIKLLREKFYLGRHTEDDVTVRREFNDFKQKKWLSLEEHEKEIDKVKWDFAQISGLRDMALEREESLQKELAELKSKSVLIADVGKVVGNYEDKFIKIRHTQSKPKTEIYEVWSKCSASILGKILWYPSWRYYVFDDGQVVLSDRCLEVLSYFVKKCNEKHKTKTPIT